MPAVESRCWHDRISPETGSTVLSLATEISDTDPLVEMAYNEGGRQRLGISPLQRAAGAKKRWPSSGPEESPVAPRRLTGIDRQGR